MTATAETKQSTVVHKSSAKVSFAPNITPFDSDAGLAVRGSEVEDRAQPKGRPRRGADEAQGL